MQQSLGDKIDVLINNAGITKDNLTIRMEPMMNGKK